MPPKEGMNFIRSSRITGKGKLIGANLIIQAGAAHLCVPVAELDLPDGVFASFGGLAGDLNPPGECFYRHNCYLRLVAFQISPPGWIALAIPSLTDLLITC